MSASRRPWMKWNPSDWRADQEVQVEFDGPRMRFHEGDDAVAENQEEIEF